MKIGPPEPAMDKRMIVAFVLMAVVMVAMPYFYKTFAPPPAKPAETAKPAKAVPAAAAPAPAPTAAAAAKPTAPVAAQAEQITVVETDLYKVTFSNRGAVARSWILKKYKDSEGKRLDLVNEAGARKTGFPFSLAFRGKKLPADVNQALYAVKTSADGLSLDYEYSDGAVSVRKSFRFDRLRYLAEFTSEASENGVPLAHYVTWRGGFGDSTALNAASQQRTVFCDVSGHPVVRTASDAKKEPVTDAGPYTFAGIEDNYFAAVFLPQRDGQVTLETRSDDVGGIQHPGAAVGGGGSRYDLFVGPKDVEILKKVDPKLEQIVDFGKWFGWLAKPLFVILNWLNDHYVHNYGWSIVLVTVLINFVMLPFRLTSMKSMKKMQALKPQIDAINAKYKNVGLRDPRKADQNAEVMDLYKKNGVNPMGGCLPMVFQIPVFISFYSVLSVAIQLRGASWFWVADLSQPERLPIHVLPILMTVAQFFQQKMTPTPGQDPTQAKMMQLMPVVMLIFLYNISSGLVLYWLTSNVVGIAQQLLINKTMPTPPAQPQAAKPKKGGK